VALDVGRLFREHHQALYRYLVAFGGDEATAKDAVQFAFLRMLERPPEDGSPRAWLYRVATNAVVEWTRSEGHRRRLAQDRGYPPALGDPPEEASRRAEVNDARDRLQRVLSRLEERDRTLLLMREEGFTHREMAEAVGTTTGSVGTLLARALKKAGAAMAEEMQ